MTVREYYSSYSSRAHVGTKHLKTFIELMHEYVLLSRNPHREHAIHIPLMAQIAKQHLEESLGQCLAQLDNVYSELANFRQPFIELGASKEFLRALELDLHTRKFIIEHLTKCFEDGVLFSEDTETFLLPSWTLRVHFIDVPDLFIEERT
ncbi:hypothetical protein PCE1_001478 [Barthelona sp. PCE]